MLLEKRSIIEGTMRRFTMNTTQQNQVTIPTVPLAAAHFTLESVYGSVPVREGSEDIDELSRIAKDEKAGRSVRELREG